MRFFELTQPRVKKGMNTQEAVVSYLRDLLGEDFKLISVAKPSSYAPDLEAEIHGVKTQIEIKGRDSKANPVKIYEKRVERGEDDPIINAFIRAYTNGKAKNLDHYIDVMRKKVDDSIGYPTDEGVTAPAGKLYVATDDSKVRNIMRRYLMDHLKGNNDDYFVIYTRSTGDIELYDTGSANSELSAPRVPNIRRVILETYGSAGTPGKMRLAIKVQFAK